MITATNSTNHTLADVYAEGAKSDNPFIAMFSQSGLRGMAAEDAKRAAMAAATPSIVQQLDALKATIVRQMAEAEAMLAKLSPVEGGGLGDDASSVGPVCEILRFTYEGQELRSVLTVDEPWFVAADICRCLGLNMAGGASAHLRKLDKDERRLGSGLNCTRR